MFSIDPLFVQAFTFTAAAVLIVAASVWRLYFSPLRNPLGTAPAPSPPLTGRLAGARLLGETVKT